MNIGHRMYPEVFSDFPDLKNIHLLAACLHTAMASHLLFSVIDQSTLEDSNSRQALGLGAF